MVPSGRTVSPWHWLHCVAAVMAAPRVSTAGCGAGGLAMKWQVPQATAAAPPVQLTALLAAPPGSVAPWQ